MASCDLAETLEESGRSVVVAAFGLDGLDHDGCDWVVEVFDQIFCLGQAARFLFGILGCVFGKWVFKVREGGLRPVEGGDVEFMDWFASSSGETAKETAVEAGSEGQD